MTGIGFAVKGIPATVLGRGCGKGCVLAPSQRGPRRSLQLVRKATIRAVVAGMPFRDEQAALPRDAHQRQRALDHPRSMLCSNPGHRFPSTLMLLNTTVSKVDRRRRSARSQRPRARERGRPACGRGVDQLARSAATGDLGLRFSRGRSGLARFVLGGALGLDAACGFVGCSASTPARPSARSCFRPSQISARTERPAVLAPLPREVIRGFT